MYSPRFIFFVTLLLTLSGVASGGGIDEEYLKPNDKKRWGKLLADAVGIDAYQKSYALIISISDYTGGYPSLPTRNDAIRMRDYLVHEAGFDYVRVITDDKVSASKLNRVILEDLRGRVDNNDRFLFYWSGHGIDVKTAQGGTEGFLPLTNSPQGAIGTMVNMGDIQRWDSFIPAEQALFLLDACFSGLAGVVRKSDHQARTIGQLAKPSHHIISAGEGDENAIAGGLWGGSLFTKAVLDGLRGAADTQNAEYPQDGVVSLYELIGYLKIRIGHEKAKAGWNKTLTPQLRDLRTSKGEFFFITNAQKIATAKREGAKPTGQFVHGEVVVEKGPRPAASTLTTRTIRESQEVLKALGYSPGPVDGEMGILTRGALRRFQRDKGLPINGDLTARTQRALEEAWSLREAPGTVVRPPVVAAGPKIAAHPPLTEFRDRLKDGSEGPVMVSIPGGTFLMGCGVGEKGCFDDEHPQHRVSIAPFAIGKTEVSFVDYDRFAQATGRGLPKARWGRGAQPVINVSWEDASAYAAWLSEQTGFGYRLPSESEWEYAARAGTTTPYSTGECLETTEANYDGNYPYETCRQSGEYREKPVEVGTLPSNRWGLHEVHGNVDEWVEDTWHENYSGAPTDGRAWVDASGELRVLRGGSWLDFARYARSAYRYRSRPGDRDFSIGFRLARGQSSSSQ